MKARLSSAIRMDTVFAPFHWSGTGRANLLTNPALDPVSKMPEFKVCAVRISKANVMGHRVRTLNASEEVSGEE